MTITLDLRPDLEVRLRENAARAGLDLEQYLLQWIERAQDSPGPTPAPGSLAELMEQWRQEDMTDDPEELRRAAEELEELKANLNANRAATGERPLFP